MFEVVVQENVLQISHELDDFSRTQAPFAIVVALTRTAWEIKAAEQDEMRSVFDDPIEFTTESLQVDQATKTRPLARVDFKAMTMSSPGHYLKPQVLGGPRRHTPFEGALIRAGVMRSTQFAVPLSGAERDGRNNLNPGQIGKILADLRANPVAVKSANYRNKGVRRAESYFTPRPGSSLPAGIYLRLGQRGIVPVFAFTLAVPTYRRLFAFDTVAQRIVDERFETNFWQALNDAVRTSNYKGKWTRR